MSTKTWVILMMEFQYAAAPLAEASLVPLNIKADMTSFGLKLRATDKTFGVLQFGKTGNYGRGDQRENIREMKTLHFHIEIKVISRIA